MVEALGEAAEARYRIGPVKPRFTAPPALIGVGILIDTELRRNSSQLPASLRRWRHPRACKFEPHPESSSLFKSSSPPAHALSMNFPLSLTLHPTTLFAEGLVASFPSLGSLFPGAPLDLSPFLLSFKGN